ncbi:hypothetical protein SBA4_640016 [Candidatus Sulfopaludibacter sp. SbA4]|nr:hypothetical protein SBA4_640016 [Candidatus Sulfopaludibacter sp. SbA4]
MSAGDLQFRVQQYEDLVQTISGSRGYGNVLLADCLRRLSLTLLIEYALAHPSENEAIAEILKPGRTRLLDSPAVGTMLAEELNLVPPREAWHLSKSREEIEQVFRATGSTYAKENGRILLGLPSTSTLANRRDVYGVLLRVLESDMLECVHLPGLIEFRRLGGRLEDLDPNDIRPYWRVMERDMRRFQFPPFGINMLRPGHLGSLVQGFDPHGKKLNTFTRRALE